MSQLSNCCVPCSVKALNSTYMRKRELQYPKIYGPFFYTSVQVFFASLLDLFR